MHAELAEEPRRGLGGAGTFDLQRLDLASFQADRRVVDRLLRALRAGRVDEGRLTLEHPLAAEIAVGSEQRLVGEEDQSAGPLGLGAEALIEDHEGVALQRIGLEQSLLRPLEHEAEPMEVAQTTAPSKRLIEVLRNELADDLPVPVGKLEPDLLRGPLDRRLQLGLGCLVEGGGEPPVCSKASAAGPSSEKASSQLPIVWASRSRASATWAWESPRDSSQRACQRSRSRGLGARYTASRTRRTSICQRSKSATISLIGGISRPRQWNLSKQAYHVHPVVLTLDLL
jgi:hypothetical protein